VSVRPGEAHRTIELKIPSEHGYEKMAMQVAAEIAGMMGFSGERIDDLRTGEERFLELTDRHGVIPAPYMARAHWVSVLPSAGMPREEIGALLRASYEQVRAKLTKKVQRELGDG
jgi:predicted DNA-binding protein (MmcQ/YjbR family)